jgi:enoyl-CoA hydratase/carnithine racemase
MAAILPPSPARSAQTSGSISVFRSGESEGLAWGFCNRLYAPKDLQAAAAAIAKGIADGPSFAHAVTKRMLQMEWAMSVDQAIEAEAVAQALCMATQDFRRAYDAFVAKQRPAFRGD